MWTSTLWHTLQTIGVADLLDIIVVSFIIYVVLLWFEWTKAAFVARGILILAALYVLARQLGMVLTTWLFHGFFAIIVIALVVIFQEELRRFFEHLAMWSWRRPRQTAFQWPEVDVLARSLTTHARAKVGALIVLKGREPLERHLQGGHDLDGQVSEPILQSIFDVHSDGHDGAVLIDGNRIRRFAVHLPLSSNFDRLNNRGTRHAAALGLAEVCDALCLVVSEQKGTISAARRGEWVEVVTEDDLARLINNHLSSLATPRKVSTWRSWFVSNLPEKTLAIGLAFALWLMFVQGFKPETATFQVPVVTQNVPPGLRVRSVNPRRINVTVSGLKRDMDYLNPSRLRAHVNLEDQGPGIDRVLIFDENMRIPASFRFIGSEPPSVEVELVAERPIPLSKKR